VNQELSDFVKIENEFNVQQRKGNYSPRVGWSRGGKLGGG